MDDGAVAAIEPAVRDGSGGSSGGAVITGHDHVAAHDDFTERLTISRHVAAAPVHNAEIARSDQFDALARFNDAALAGTQAGMLGPWLADGNEGRNFRQAVDLCDFPAQFAFDSFDGGGGWRRSRSHDPH